MRERPDIDDARDPFDEVRARGVSPPARAVLLRIAGLAVAVRLVLGAVGLGSSSAAFSGPLGRLALGMWSRWDAPHYLRVAEVGYRAHGEDALFIVFFPMYPAAVRAVSYVFGSLIVSGLVVSYLATVGTAWFLYRLVRLDAEHDEAWRAVVLLFAFPTAYFLALPYSEALLLLGVTASMYAARKGAAGRAGALGAVATATRVAGIALLAPLTFLAWRDAWDRRDLIRRLAWTAVVPAGLIAYLVINRLAQGDALAFLEVQRRHWSQGPVPPWEPLTDAVRRIGMGWWHGDYLFVFAGRIAGAAAGVALLVAGRRRLVAAEQVYAWAGLVLVLSTAWLISLPRYLLALYPLVVVQAWMSRRRWVYATFVAMGAAMQFAFFWRYARGWWTF